ncbi:MAG: hypothetical protein IJ551_09770 [Prevotella sp.]|nr:hypothetical protein [Prevotella sp.]
MPRNLQQTEIMQRWHQKMPRFFYWLVVVAAGVGGAAVAINTIIPATGGTLHEWWTDLYPYVLGTCIGIVFVCKFTVAGGYKQIDPDALLHGDHTVLDQDIDHMHADSPDVPGVP